SYPEPVHSGPESKFPVAWFSVSFLPHLKIAVHFNSVLDIRAHIESTGAACFNFFVLICLTFYLTNTVYGGANTAGEVLAANADKNKVVFVWSSNSLESSATVINGTAETTIKNAEYASDIHRCY
ncbi:hypothetical protein H8S45_15560, partial [Agathobaculum sp. NSJ-28]